MNCNFYTNESWITKKCPQKVMGAFVKRLKKKVFWHPQFYISSTTCSQPKCTPTFSRNILSETTNNHPYFLLDFLILMYLYVHFHPGPVKSLVLSRQENASFPSKLIWSKRCKYHWDFCDICHNSHWASK